MGNHFWGRMFLAIIGIGLAAMIAFLIIGAALTTWGILGALFAIFVVILAAGWYLDRRRANEYAE